MTDAQRDVSTRLPNVASPPPRSALRTAASVVRYPLAVVYVLAIGYLCFAAVQPAFVDSRHPWVSWFANQGSTATILVVLGIPVLILLCSRLAGHKFPTTAPLLLLAGMAASAMVLGFVAYLPCANDDNSAIFGPLTWALGLFVGNLEPRHDGIGDGACDQLPVALELARLLALATTLGTAATAALSLFRAQRDRIVIALSRARVVVVGLDEETVSLVKAISQRMDSRETLVIVTGSADRGCITEARELGARIREVSMLDPSALSELRLWRKLDRLYLLSEDPIQNEIRLAAINAAMDSLGDRRFRLPLTVRIDDPWQAEVWRRSFLDGDDDPSSPRSRNWRWAADAVGKYEVTAAKVVRHLGAQRASSQGIDAVLLCGLYPLTYAISSELAQVHREMSVLQKGQAPQKLTVKIIAKDSEGFLRDYHWRQNRIAPGDTPFAIEPVKQEPTLDAIVANLEQFPKGRCAVVLCDPSMASFGTRLAARERNLLIYQASTTAVSLPAASIVGRLFPFPITMDLDPTAPHDVWERAAELMHEEYRAHHEVSPAVDKPFAELDPFVRQSNRRAVVNALWMVEHCGHTWNTLEHPASAPLRDDFGSLPDTQQFATLGFGESAVDEMVGLEHEDWRRFYLEHGWKYSDTRNDAKRRHDRLVTWADLLARDAAKEREHREQGTAVDPSQLFRTKARGNLISVLLTLRRLGYQSIPKPAARPDEPTESDLPTPPSAVR